LHKIKIISFRLIKVMTIKSSLLL